MSSTECSWRAIASARGRPYPGVGFPWGAAVPATGTLELKRLGPEGLLPIRAAIWDPREGEALAILDGLDIFVASFELRRKISDLKDTLRREL